jgi:hypothetical protein
MQRVYFQLKKLLRLGKTQALEIALAKSNGMHSHQILQAKFEAVNLKVTCRWPRATTVLAITVQVITALVIIVQVTVAQVTTAQVTTALVTAVQVTTAQVTTAPVTTARATGVQAKS